MGLDSWCMLWHAVHAKDRTWGLDRILSSTDQQKEVGRRLKKVGDTGILCGTLSSPDLASS